MAIYSTSEQKSSHLPNIDTLLRNSSYIFLFLKVLPYEKKEKTKKKQAHKVFFLLHVLHETSNKT